MSNPITGRSPTARTSRGAQRPKRRRWKKLTPAARYGVLVAVLGALVTLAQFVVHGLRAEPRDMRGLAERELTVNTLAVGERAVLSTSVFRRPAIDYFRATRGLLVLTNRRLIFLGLHPRDFMAATDAPPTFEERDFPIDTAVTVDEGRAFFGVTHGVVVRAPGETLRLAVPSASWDAAQSLVLGMHQRDNALRGDGIQQRHLRERADAEQRAALAERHKPQYYTVRRGDAIGAIATQWNLTLDRLLEWNHKPDSKIRVGETLLVRPAE
jgi:LysM repeat protein